MSARSVLITVCSKTRKTCRALGIQCVAAAAVTREGGRGHMWPQLCLLSVLRAGLSTYVLNNNKAWFAINVHREGRDRAVVRHEPQLPLKPRALAARPRRAVGMTRTQTGSLKTVRQDCPNWSRKSESCPLAPLVGRSIAMFRSRLMHSCSTCLRPQHLAAREAPIPINLVAYVHAKNAAWAALLGLLLQANEGLRVTSPARCALSSP